MHEHHLVTAGGSPVPWAVHADEGATAIPRRQQRRIVESQPQRSHVRAERIVRHDGPCHEVGLLRLDFLIDMRAVVTVGPAVETAFAYRRPIIRHQVAAEFVALVDYRPPRTCPQTGRASWREKGGPY